MNLTFNNHLPPLTQYSLTSINSISHLHAPSYGSQAVILFEKSTVFTVSYKDPPKVVIYINYDGLESPMLHTKLRGNRSTGSGGEDFKRYIPYMGMAAILIM